MCSSCVRLVASRSAPRASRVPAARREARFGRCDRTCTVTSEFGWDTGSAPGEIGEEDWVCQGGGGTKIMNLLKKFAKNRSVETDRNGRVTLNEWHATGATPICFSLVLSHVQTDTSSRWNYEKNKFIIM